MPRLHHVNIGIPDDKLADETLFLTEIVGLRHVSQTPPPANWFDADDGVQVHVSLDPHHMPSTRAHVAMNLGDRVPQVEQLLISRGIPYRGLDGDDPAQRRLFLADPGGNFWELRPGA